MSTEFTIKPLDESTWDAFAALVEANNGVFGGCWCIGFHPEGADKESAELNRRNKLERVKQGTTHAALVFADFMLSPEGQQLIKKRNRVPSSRAVKTPLNDFPYQMIDPVISLDEEAKWEKIWTDLFLKGQKMKKESD